MIPRLRKILFETLYRNKYLYRFASTVPFAGQWRTWQRQVLPLLHGRDVLELGCGLGDLLADMLAAGYTCHAVELSPQMVSAARETLSRRHLGSPGLIIQGSAQSLPFSTGSFDSVVSTFPSEYIYDPDTSAEVARVLRSGGRLIVIEGANLLPVGFFQPVLLLLHMLVYGPGTFLKSRQNSNLNTPNQRSSQQRESAPGDTPEGEPNAPGIKTIEIANPSFGQHIPLEKVGLIRRSQIARSQRWEIFITIGEKPQRPSA
jgi:SAM-dependent methyltransferase